jgi:site-specific DNA-methyltransferase (adenine-specific)
MNSIELILGDCLEVMKEIPDKSIDAIITDLPYGTTACSWDNVIPFEPMWEQVKRINKGVFVTTASQPFTSKLVMSNLKDFKYEWVWEKNMGSNFAALDYMPMKQHENILVFGNGKTVYNPQMIDRADSSLKRDSPNKPPRVTTSKHKKDGIYGNAGMNKQFFGGEGWEHRNPKSVLFYKVRDGKIKTYHSTQKPVALYEYLIKTYTNEGDTVLDITMGSGTTGVACVQTGRNFIGIEIDPTYYAIAEKRIKDAQQQMRLPLESA